MSWLRRKLTVYIGYLAPIVLFINLVLLPDNSWRWNSDKHFPFKKNIVRRAAGAATVRDDNALFPGERQGQGEGEEYWRFKNNTVVRLWVELSVGFPWRKCLKEQHTLLLMSGCVAKVHQQADQTFTVLTLPGDDTKFKLLHVRRFRMFLVRPDDAGVVRLLGYSHSPTDYWQWRRSGQLSYGETGRCVTASLARQSNNKTVMAQCGDRLDQRLEFGVDTFTEGENTIRPLQEEDWHLRMKARREVESERAREDVQTALAEMTSLRSSQSAGRKNTGRRGVVLQVERGDSARRYLSLWLETARLGGLQSDNKTDIILFTHPSSVSQLPPHCRAVREEAAQAGRCLFKAFPEQGSHRKLLQILAGPESSFLLRYDTLIRADLHSLPTPALHHLQSEEVLVSRVSRTAASPRLTSVEEEVERTARVGGVEHRGWHDLGLTILAPPPTLRQLANLTLALERLSLAEMFGAGSQCRCSSCSQLPLQCQRGRGPFPGHVTRYAENIALNALLTESQYLASHQYFRQGNSSDPHLDLCSLGLLDTREDREVRAVLECQGRFRKYDMTQLDISTARGWSLYTALTSTEQGVGAPTQSGQLNGTSPLDFCSRPGMVDNIL